MANLPLPRSGAALVAAMAGVSDVIKAKGELWALKLHHCSGLTPVCTDCEQGERSWTTTHMSLASGTFSHGYPLLPLLAVHRDRREDQRHSAAPAGERGIQLYEP